jgi:soluble lytic murein transglycosylase
MTPGASIGSARARSRRSRSRSSKRRVGRATMGRRGRRRRRTLVIAGALIAGVGVGLLLGGGEKIEETLREITLPLRHDDIIRQQSAEKGVPPELIAAVIWKESKFRDQTSNAGARGLMQITPTTAKEIEKLSGGQTFEFDDLADPDINIRYGTFYLAHLLDLYEGNEVAALAAYNAGPTIVEEWGGKEADLDQIDFGETHDYVEDVLDKRDEYAEHYGPELGLE